MDHIKSDKIIIIVWFFLLSCFLYQTLNLSLIKYYSIDEFQYSHAAWLFSKGVFPYKDFFEHHFPFSYQLLSISFLFLDDNPNNIIFLRILMLPFVAIILLSSHLINSRHGFLVGITSPLLITAVWTFITKATEIRPDTIAFSFIILAIALTYKIRRARLKGFCVGFLVVLAVWTTQKVFYYGLVFLIAFLVDLAWNRKYGGGNYLLGSPQMVIMGCLSVLLPISAYLSITNSWQQCYYWCIEWAFTHEKHYPGFSWVVYFSPFFLDYWWLFLLAVIGLNKTVNEIICQGENCWSNPDFILIGTLLTTFISFVVTTAPFIYNLIPFIPVLSIFAARGFICLLRQPCKLHFQYNWLVRKLCFSLCIVLLLKALYQIEGFVKSSNAYQHEVLTTINNLTNSEDSIYDNSGGFIARPHVYYYFFTNALLRKDKKEYIEEIVPKSILKSQCVMVLHDVRFKDLPEKLKKFILNHFQPFNGDIRLWGQRYQVQSLKRLESEFIAIKSGKYFIYPYSSLNNSELKIDGRKISNPIFELDKGQKKISYSGMEEEFFIIWLPRNGRPFKPDFSSKAQFSKLL